MSPRPLSQRSLSQRPLSQRPLSQRPEFQRPCTDPTRIPRAYLDPVDNEADALALIGLAMHDPLEREIIAFLLDDDNLGGTITVVADPYDDDAVLRVTELLCEAAEDDLSLCRLVIASVRPDRGIAMSDVFRWHEACLIAASSGIELIEWFVIGPEGPACPRDLAGENQRW